MLKPKNVKFLSGSKELYENFQKHHVIGHGNSFVFQVINSEGTSQCVKQIILEDKQNEFIYLKEIEFLNKLKANPHPNIVEFKGSYILIEKKTQGKSIKKGFIQMQRGMTNLKSYVQQKKTPFNQDQVMDFLNSMIDVFAHLQKIQVAHRDIKPSNILVFDEDPLWLKVCDVGAGTAVGECENTKERTVIGTPYYLSPELYQAHTEKRNLTNYNPYKSDVYSLGLLFIEFCLYKRVDNRLKGEQAQVMTKIKQAKDKYPNIIGLGKVLRCMLEYDVSKRMDFIDLKAFVNDNNLLRNRIDKSLALSPEFSQKLSSQSSIFIETIDELSQLNMIVSTKSNINALKIHIEPNINPLKNRQKQLLEELSKIRHMKLSDLQIDIEICGIEDKHINLITDAFQRNEKLNKLKLNFWNNSITNESFLPLLKAINQHLFFLEELKIHFPSNQIRIDDSYKGAFNFSNITNLRVLDLNLSFNHIPPEHLTFMAQDISELKFLQELSLTLQNIKSNPVHFSKAMKHLSSLHMMREFKINVSSNSIRDEGMFGLSDAIIGFGQSLKKCQIIMRSAEIQDKGFNEFMKACAKTVTLNELKLNLLSNELTEKGIKNASISFEELKSLKVLDLNFANNEGIDDSSIRQLSKSLLTIKTYTKLRLVLDSIDLTQKGCLYLGRLISEEPSLQALDISLKHNDIKLAGVQYICAGIIKVKRLKKIRICCEATNIGDQSANYLAMCLLKMRHLTTVDLNLDNCNLSCEAVENIIKTVKECSKKAEEITINLRRNHEMKSELYQQIKKDLQGSRVAIRIDNPDTDILDKTSQSMATERTTKTESVTMKR